MTDPDADLIEAMARAIDAKLKFSFKIWLSPMSAEAAARAALAVARVKVLEEALAWIEAHEPATQEMTLAHEMAACARAALSTAKEST